MLAGVGLHAALHLGGDPLEHGAVGADDRLADPRLEERAAVGERGVGASELERRDQRVALADGEVHGVARAVVAALEAELVREDVQEVPLRQCRLVLLVDLAVVALHRLPVGELPVPVGDPAARLPRQVDAGLLAEAEVLRALDQRVLGVDVLRVGAVAVPEAQPDAVEEGVAGVLQGLREVDVAVGTPTRSS